MSASQIPTQVGDIDVEKLPGPEVLLTPGDYQLCISWKMRLERILNFSLKHLNYIYPSILCKMMFLSISHLSHLFRLGPRRRQSCRAPSSIIDCHLVRAYTSSWRRPHLLMFSFTVALHLLLSLPLLLLPRTLVSATLLISSSFCLQTCPFYWSRLLTTIDCSCQ